MASKPAALALVAFGGLGLVLQPSDAAAFCRTTTSVVPPDFQPGNGQCWTQGLPLWWRNGCVGYSIQKDASRQISYNDAANAIATAFGKWTASSCASGGTGASRVSIDVRDLGPVTCNQVQYNTDQPNQHSIIFRDDTWPHNDANNTLALTTVVFNPDTGEIYDADMEINTAQVKLTIADPIAPDGYDFASIVTHETGHFLGMAHSSDSHATMFAHYNQGSTTLRNLTADDVNGICSIYPPDGTRAVATSVAASGRIPEDSCDPTPRHGFSTECGSPTTKTSGCSIATRGGGGAGGPGGDGFEWLSLAAGGFLVLGARKRARRRAGSSRL